ncbi:hypothetical protein HN51_016813 [Arachis hypogaea]|uniref:Transcription factor n=2 Tax=Arachis TaxID=3817 RepID=A0A445CUP4_ARAHY|nr:transcription factor MYB98 isoform X1 [Arachis duranensis]XP_025607378.1 transcription factor MYB98 [Arachis hypogaea]RYR54642.1 hypothetical protein Ahy_A06g029952 [Arachis hypogaea]
MEFNQNFFEDFTYLSGTIYENPCIKTEISTMVPMQQKSLLVYPPLKNEILYKNDFHHLQSLKDITNTFCSMAFVPNKNQVEDIHAFPNNHNSLWDLSQKNQVQIDDAFVPSLIYDASLLVPMNFKLQDELSTLTPTENAHWNNIQNPFLNNQMPQKKGLRRKGNIQQSVTEIIKGQWSADEDMLLTQLVELFGFKNWTYIATLISGRIGKQCRERWFNHLQPDIKKDSWDEEEDKLLIEAHKQVGNKWAEIARRLPGRTENTIKNHWNAAKRKKSSKRQPRKKKNQTYFGESLLERYVKEVTAADAAKKQLKKSMKQLKIKNEDYNLQQNACITGYGGNIPVKFSSNEIGNGSVLIDGTENYVPMELDMIGIEAYMN